MISQARTCRREKAARAERHLEGAKEAEHPTPNGLPLHVFPESRVFPSTEGVPSKEEVHCKAEEKQMRPRLLRAVGQGKAQLNAWSIPGLRVVIRGDGLREHAVSPPWSLGINISPHQPCKSDLTLDSLFSVKHQCPTGSPQLTGTQEVETYE